MEITTFELERRQSLWENRVDYNLTESGIHPLTLQELLTEAEQQELLKLELGYGQTNGDEALRDQIAALYGGRSWDKDHVLVTNGSSEANLLAVHTLLDPGDELIFMMPNYQQMNGLAASCDIEVKSWWLRERHSWQPSMDDLRSMITDQTRMVAVCNPNNPTGQVMPEDQMEELVEIVDQHNLVLYSDEVYRGAELDGEETVSFADLYDQAVVCGGLSKAYSLPGLRLGWVAGPQSNIEQAWHHRDYTSIASGLLSQYVAGKALQPSRRTWILDRNRRLLRDNLKYFRAWSQKHRHRFSYMEPQGGGIVWMGYDHPMNSTELTRKLREEESVFLVAGDCFGLDKYIRIGIGAEPEYLKEGLQRFDRWIDQHW